MDSLADIIEVSCNDSVDPKKSISKLVFEIKRYQQKTKSHIDANYSDFLINLSSNDIYLNEGEKLINEVNNILQIFENDTKTYLHSATDELKFYIEELQEISLGLKVSYKILKIDKLFEDLEESRNNNEYLQVMNIIDEIKSLMDDPTDKILTRLNCFQNIKIKYHIESEMLLHNLKQHFERLIQFNEKLFQNTKSVTLKISKDETKLQKIVIALFNAKYNPKKMCDFLIENVFKPIVDKPVSIQLVGTENDANNDVIGTLASTDSDCVQLFLSFSLKDLGEDLRPNYKTVFQNIEIVIKCLSKMNIKISDSMCVFQILNEFIEGKLVDLIINECIMYSIPDTMDEMNDSKIIDDILLFDEFLKKSQFLKKENNVLQEFSKKIKILFLNRFCSNIVENAVEIIKKDLYDMTAMPENKCSLMASADRQLIFPQCMISTSINELILLMENILRQVSTADEESSGRLMSTIPIILTHYLDKVPVYHEKVLKNIPQQTALFYNNCMYLVFWLQKNCDKNLESIDKFVHSLEHLAKEFIESQIKTQQAQILEILQEFDFTEAISQLGFGPQKAVRQCLRQFNFLENVWQSVLPDPVYDKIMCNLLNDFCSEIIRKVLCVEDLPIEVANGLDDIFSTIIEQAPDVFKNKHQVYEVKVWMKLKQLKMILNASLVEITEQWSEGKGPLAMSFKAEEVKHLIRALFQNTDRRANALALIC